MWDRAVDPCREPAEGFFDDAAEVREAAEVGDCRERGAGAEREDTVEFGVCGSLDAREESHGFYEGDERVAGGVGAGFECDAGDVGGGLRGEEGPVWRPFPCLAGFGDVGGKCCDKLV